MHLRSGRCWLSWIPRRVFHIAMAEADDDFDTSRVDELIGRWWARAMVLLNPDPEADAAWERIKAGDESDIVEEWRHAPDGSRHVYRPTTTPWTSPTASSCTRWSNGV